MMQPQSTLFRGPNEHVGPLKKDQCALTPKTCPLRKALPWGEGVRRVCGPVGVSSRRGAKRPYQSDVKVWPATGHPSTKRSGTADKTKPAYLLAEPEGALWRVRVTTLARSCWTEPLRPYQRARQQLQGKISRAISKSWPRH